MKWYEYARTIGYRNPMYLPQKIKDSINVPESEASKAQESATTGEITNGGE